MKCRSAIKFFICNGEQWDFQNNEKTMKHSGYWFVTGWHGEQWDFQNNEKTCISNLEMFWKRKLMFS